MTYTLFYTDIIVYIYIVYIDVAHIIKCMYNIST